MPPETPGLSSYAVITPARDEADNLPRLAESLAAQHVIPLRWMIVDNGSTDGTPQVAADLADRHPWITVISVPGERDPVRGRPIVRSFMAALEALGDLPEVVVNVDADISFAPDYFERLLAAFATDPRLGIASGSGYELDGDTWRQRHLTGTTVWGASRAYRRACLQDVLPLAERLGWDGTDEFKANARGWTTRTLVDLPFHHHRAEGERDGAWRSRVEQGRIAHYMGYRPSYLALRAAFNGVRHPSGLGLLWGYLAQAARRAEREPDAGARAYLRSQQRARNVPARLREARGRAGS